MSSKGENMGGICVGGRREPRYVDGRRERGVWMSELGVPGAGFDGRGCGGGMRGRRWRGGGRWREGK